MATKKVIYIVMTSSDYRHTSMSCIGAFDDRGAAEMYAEQVMTDAVRDEGMGLEIDDIEHSEIDYMLVLSHEGLELNVIVDHCPDRTGE